MYAGEPEGKGQEYQEMKWRERKESAFEEIGRIAWHTVRFSSSSESLVEAVIISSLGLSL